MSNGNKSMASTIAAGARALGQSMIPGGPGGMYLRKGKQGRDWLSFAMSQAAARKQKNEAQRHQRDATVAAYVNQIPADFDLSQIPQKYRQNIKDALVLWKRQANAAAVNITHLTPGEEMYQQQVDIMNGVKNRMRNLKQQWLNFGEGKKAYLTDYSDKNFSNRNNPDIMTRNANLFTDKYDVHIDPEDGNIFFGSDDTPFFNYADTYKNEPFLKAFEQSNKYLNWNKDIVNAGKELDNAQLLMYDGLIKNMLNEGDWDDIQSLISDDLFIGNTMEENMNALLQSNKANYSNFPANNVDEAMALANVDDPNIYGPAREAIQQLLSDTMLDNLKKSAKNSVPKGGLTGDLWSLSNVNNTNFMDADNNLDPTKYLANASAIAYPDGLPENTQTLLEFYDTEWTKYAYNLMSSQLQAFGLQSVTGGSPLNISYNAGSAGADGSNPTFTVTDREGDQIYDASATLKKLKGILSGVKYSK